MTIYRNAIHRDIKPENILINAQGIVKLADFNIMKNLDVSMAKTQKGTPFYMSPDVAFGKEYSHNVDVWSLCATFYHAIKGKAPYDADHISNPIQLLMRKKDPENYDRLTAEDFPCAPLVEIINHNLSIVSSEDDDLRIGVGQIHKIIEQKVNISKFKKGIYSNADTLFWQQLANKDNREDSIFIVRETEPQKSYLFLNPNHKVIQNSSIF
jgi:serine/threonine protein kinase